MTVLQGLLRQLPTSSKETAEAENPPPIFEEAKFDFAVTAMPRKGFKSWAFPCEFWFDTKAKVNVLCTECLSEDERDWRGRIIGKGICGSFNALKIRHKNKTSMKPLIGVFTVCFECRRDLDGDADQIYRVSNNSTGLLILSLSGKEVEDMVSCKVIVIQGMSTKAIKTLGVDWQWKEWLLLKSDF